MIQLPHQELMIKALKISYNLLQNKYCNEEQRTLFKTQLGQQKEPIQKLFNSLLNAEDNEFVTLLNNFLNNFDSIHKEEEINLSFDIELSKEELENELTEISIAYYLSDKSKISKMKQLLNMIEQEESNQNQTNIITQFEENIQAYSEKLDLYIKKLQKFCLNQNFSFLRKFNSEAIFTFIQELLEALTTFDHFLILQINQSPFSDKLEIHTYQDEYFGTMNLLLESLQNEFTDNIFGYINNIEQMKAEELNSVSELSKILNKIFNGGKIYTYKIEGINNQQFVFCFHQAENKNIFYNISNNSAFQGIITAFTQFVNGLNQLFEDSQFNYQEQILILNSWLHEQAYYIVKTSEKLSSAYLVEYFESNYQMTLGQSFLPQDNVIFKLNNKQYFCTEETSIFSTNELKQLNIILNKYFDEIVMKKSTLLNNLLLEKLFLFNSNKGLLTLNNEGYITFVNNPFLLKSFINNIDNCYDESYNNIFEEYPKIVQEIFNLLNNYSNSEAVENLNFEIQSNNSEYFIHLTKLDGQAKSASIIVQFEVQTYSKKYSELINFFESVINNNYDLENSCLYDFMPYFNKDLNKSISIQKKCSINDYDEIIDDSLSSIKKQKAKLSLSQYSQRKRFSTRLGQFNEKTKRLFVRQDTNRAKTICIQKQQSDLQPSSSELSKELTLNHHSSQTNKIEEFMNKSNEMKLIQSKLFSNGTSIKTPLIKFRIPLEDEINPDDLEDSNMKEIDIIKNDIEVQILNYPSVIQKKKFVWAMFKVHGFIDTLQFDKQIFCNFINEVYRKYSKTNNSFHNFDHAITVMNGIYFLLATTNLSKILPPLAQFTLLFSGLCHDVGHRGKNNAFESNKKSKLAKRYYDSILESYHIATTLKILSNSENNFLASMELPQFQKFKKDFIANILATDMSKHFEIMECFEKKILTKQRENILNYEDDTTISRISSFTMHTCDFFASTKAIPHSVEWSKKCNKEFHQQYKSEEKLGLPLTSFMKNLDDEKVMAKGEQGFLNFIVLPIWSKLNNFVENTVESRLNNISSLIDYWSKVEKNEIIQECILIEKEEVESNQSIDQ